jgi:hypothetical protein
MIRLTLTSEERAAVEGLRRDATLSPAERDRVELVLLSAAGWSPPRIAAHLGYHPATVRTMLVRFHESGPASLCRKPLGPRCATPSPPPSPPTGRPASPNFHPNSGRQLSAR